MNRNNCMKNSNRLVVLKSAFVVALIVCMMLLAACGVQKEFYAEPEHAIEADNTTSVVQEELTEPEDAAGGTQNEAVQKEETYTEFETEYGKLLFPEEQSEKLLHKEVTDGNITMEIFSMKTGNTERELFRIYYGDANTGDSIGILKTESGDIPVTVVVSEYQEETFLNEEDQETYAKMMDGLESVIDSIWQDESFAEPNEVEIEEVENNLQFWNVNLPESVEWEETTDNDSYQVVFYGNVNGQKVQLYSTVIGEPVLESVLGTYLLDGVQKTVSVESYDLPDVTNWPESEKTELYMLMGSINDLINAIMESEAFTEEVA